MSWRSLYSLPILECPERKLMLTIRSILCSTSLLIAFAAFATTGVASLTSNEAGTGLKAAITRGSEFAVAELGKNGGFLGNERVRIALPESLRKAESAARTLGFGTQADALIEAMNHAAEAAVLEARPLLVNAVKNMSFKDAKDILLGEQDAATQYFKRTTSGELAEKFLPVVKKATAKVELAQRYNEFAGKAAKFGLIAEKDGDIDSYVTRKTMDGLFVMIAEKEKQIRSDPVGTGSSLLKKVFGSIGK
jgi:hypothetical protein